MDSPAASRSNFRVTVHHNYEGCVYVGLGGWTITDPVGPRLMLPKNQMPPPIVAQIEAGVSQFRVSFQDGDLFKFGQWAWQISEALPTQALDVAVAAEDANVEVSEDVDVDYGFDPEQDGSAYQTGTFKLDTITFVPEMYASEPPIGVETKANANPDAPIRFCDLAEVHFKFLGIYMGNTDSKVTLSVGAYGGEVWDENYACNVSELPEAMQQWVWDRALKPTQSYCTVYIPDGMLGDPGEWEFDKVFDPPKLYETVDHPDHYNWHPKGIECIDVIEDFQNVNVAFAIKHLWRVGRKPNVNAEQDLDKAIWYLQREKQRLASSKEN